MRSKENAYHTNPCQESCQTAITSIRNAIPLSGTTSPPSNDLPSCESKSRMYGLDLSTTRHGHRGLAIKRTRMIVDTDTLQPADKDRPLIAAKPPAVPSPGCEYESYGMPSISGSRIRQIVLQMNRCHCIRVRRKSPLSASWVSGPPPAQVPA